MTTNPSRRARRDDRRRRLAEWLDSEIHTAAIGADPTAPGAEQEFNDLTDAARLEGWQDDDDPAEDGADCFETDL